MAQRYFFVVSYDISEPKRLKRVHQFLRDFGVWKQRSVFECWLTKEEYTALKKGLKQLIKPREDRVRFYRLCETCRKRAQSYGWAKLPENYEEEVVF